MRNALIVANRTVGGDQLQAAVHERLSSGPCTFHLVIPVSGVVSSAVAVGSAASDTLPITPLDFINERDLAEKRLLFGLEWLRSLGAHATGEVLPEPDTVTGVCRAVQEHGSTEVIVSTLPTTVSRWLRQDLPHRLERKVSVPVVVVTSTSAPTSPSKSSSAKSISTSVANGASTPPSTPEPPPAST